MYIHEQNIECMIDVQNRMSIIASNVGLKTQRNLRTSKILSVTGRNQITNNAKKTIGFVPKDTLINL